MPLRTLEKNTMEIRVGREEGGKKGENTPEKASSWGFMLSGERGTNDTDPMKPFKKDVFPKKGNA